MKKRVIALVLAVLVLCALLVGCGSKGTCEVCGRQNVSGKTMTVMGAKGFVCNDCAKLVSAVGSLGGLLG